MVTDWHTVPVEQVASELVRLNRGAPPRSFEECCDVATALNWRIRLLPPDVEPVPHADPKKHVIYLPPADPRDRYRMALHEISELITAKEGGEPLYHFEGNSEEHHNVAELLVDRIHSQIALEREALLVQIAETQASAAAIRRHLNAMSLELQLFLEAAAQGIDTYAMHIPDSRDLMLSAADLKRHTDRLEIIQARLRCI